MTLVGDLQKCHCSRLSQYAMIFSQRRSFLGKKYVTVGDCHCNRCHRNRSSLYIFISLQLFAYTNVSLFAMGASSVSSEVPCEIHSPKSDIHFAPLRLTDGRTSVAKMSRARSKGLSFSSVPFLSVCVLAIGSSTSTGLGKRDIVVIQQLTLGASKVL